uniref:RNA binding motif protein 15B n=1 Tax=Takifugu rubripes TaxID=31033 RepID=A0A674PB50_TAKRU
MKRQAGREPSPSRAAAKRLRERERESGRREELQPPPLALLLRERLLDYYGMLDERGRPYGFPPMPVVEDLKPEDDQRATSNLFIGNLDGNVTEVELRRGFDKYGIIEDVVIKRPARGQGGAYAFVKFQNLDMAHRAKVAMQGRLIGGNPIKIGYGKANPTTRLWVGGLGPGNSLAALAREFDRFGSIRNIDYVKGDSFAYIQYESLDAAQAACTQMRGFPLGGPERRLRVDFAKVEESPSRPFPPGYQPPVAPLAHYELLSEAYGHRSLEREVRGAREERERVLLDREYPASPSRLAERRAGGVEAFGRSRGGRSRSRSRERWLKEREERRSRRRSRSPSADRLTEERGRSRARGPGGAATPDASPDRARVRAPDSTTEPRDHSPDSGPGGRHPPTNEEEPSSGRYHTKRSSGAAAAAASVTLTTLTSCFIHLLLIKLFKSPQRRCHGAAAAGRLQTFTLPFLYVNTKPRLRAR